MSPKPVEDPARPPSPNGVELVLLPRVHDVGGFEVRRALPARERQMVGPFIFFDQMGPGEFLAGRGLDVRPHPHIGLSTVTYLFDGSILHRDSIGSEQPIVPGDVNWMTAGRGIAHSERTDPALRTQTLIACSASSPGLPCRRVRRKRRPALSTIRLSACPLSRTAACGCG
jgi:redox-sensitive bicupin YhaK (pirin superfamily)